jgi:hypothetical protein
LIGIYNRLFFKDSKKLSMKSKKPTCKVHGKTQSSQNKISQYLLPVGLFINLRVFLNA